MLHVSFDPQVSAMEAGYASPFSFHKQIESGKHSELEDLLIQAGTSMQSGNSFISIFGDMDSQHRSCHYPVVT
jgi:hypothetical protein